MNIRDVAGVSSQQELYEEASKHGLHVGSLEQLIRYTVEMQRRALTALATGEDAIEIRVIGEGER